MNKKRWSNIIGKPLEKPFRIVVYNKLDLVSDTTPHHLIKWIKAYHHQHDNVPLFFTSIQKTCPKKGILPIFKYLTNLWVNHHYDSMVIQSNSTTLQRDNIVPEKELRDNTLIHQRDQKSLICDQVSPDHTLPSHNYKLLSQEIKPLKTVTKPFPSARILIIGLPNVGKSSMLDAIYNCFSNRNVNQWKVGENPVLDLFINRERQEIFYFVNQSLIQRMGH